MTLAQYAGVANVQLSNEADTWLISESYVLRMIKADFGSRKRTKRFLGSVNRIFSSMNIWLPDAGCFMAGNKMAGTEIGEARAWHLKVCLLTYIPQRVKIAERVCQWVILVST